MKALRNTKLECWITTLGDKKKMRKEKSIYQVWINQCWECTDISNIVVRNWNDIKEVDEVENAIKKKYSNGSDGWNESYKYIIEDPEEYKKNITINTRKYKIYAEVERHKCSRGGGNY